LRLAIGKFLILTCSIPVGAQTSTPPVAQPSPGPIDDTLVAGGSDADTPERRLVSWNEYEGKYWSIRDGGRISR